VDSTNPDADAEIIARMRARMDKIHREQHRPTVGLVLSGGGAKGSAHVGVLKYLEEQEIPVDAIFGTSMGGLVGGIASLGYSPDYMDSLLRAQDWGVMLTDKIDRSYYSFKRKHYRETYLFSLPFHYSKKDFQDRIDEQVRYTRPGSSDEYGDNTLMSSLPSGYVYGFNVNNMLSSLSVGYQDDMSFSELPIPFFCVAADMVSVKAKNWSYGSLKTAMRSTMSIPGMFKPVRTQGMVLVDGGVRNNFPVDLAKAMGCDIIIGVNLSDKAPSYSQINNIVDIIMRFISMLGSESMAQNQKATDVYIKPRLDGYNMLSFSPAAIDTMIHRGYVAAREKADDLAEVKSMMRGAKPYISAKPAIDINKTPVQIYAVEFKGLSNVESRILQKRIKFREGSYVDKTRMDEMMSKIEATGCFSTVTYSILGTEEPFRLVFDCEKGPRHQFGAGIRFDTEEWASFLFHVGLNSHRLSGPKLDLSAKIGRSQMVYARGSLDISWFPTVNMDLRLDNVTATVYMSLASTGEECRWWGHRERLYLSNLHWTDVDFNVGVQNRFFRLSPRSAWGFALGQFAPQLLSGSYVGLFGSWALNTCDRLYYPQKGVNLYLGYNYDFIKIGVPSFKPLHQLQMDFSPVLPIGGRFAVIPDIHLRALIGSAKEPTYVGDNDNGFSYAHQNYVGGMIDGRYIDGQVPFIGFGNGYMASPYMSVAQLNLRYNVIENLYVTATGGWFREGTGLREFFSTEALDKFGAGLELGYRTKAGPLKLTGTWCNRMGALYQDLGLYISLGFDF